MRRSASKSKRLIYGLLGSLLCTPALAERVELSGVSGKLKDNVIAHLGLAAESCEAPAARVRQQYGRSEKQILQALKAFGHYRPKISRALEFPAQACWNARFEIAPGPVTRIRNMDVRVEGSGSEDPALQETLSALPLRPGDELRHDQYQQIRDALTSLAAERGYLDARFTRAELLVDPEQSQADILLTLDSGLRYRFGEIHIEQDAYQPRLVNSLITLKRGTDYDAKLLLEQNQAINGSGFFDWALIQPQTDARKDGEVPIQIRLEPRKRHRYSSGVGVSTDTGPRLSVGYENRRITSSGHSIESGLSLSPVISEFKNGYRIPLARALTDSLSFEAGLKQEDTETARSRVAALGGRHTLGRAHDWTETRYLQLSRENYRIGSLDDTATLLMPGLSLSRRSVDHPVHPSRGLRLRGEVRGASEALVSSATFGQVLGQAKWIAPLPAKMKLITRGEIGLSALQRFQDLPASVRFFAGGDSSVRGYDYQSLGPEDSEGDVRGGRHLLVGSVELERSVFTNFGIAGFFDIGNAIDDFSDPLAKGAGLGLRWRSPVGPVGIDLAHPFDETDELLRVHLRFGPEL